MNFLPSFTAPALITHVPDGYDALLLSELSDKGKSIVYIARDEERAQRLKDQLSFFKPAHKVLYFPAWDCLPFDRNSPHPDILAQRLDTLTFLATSSESYVLITSIEAWLQKLPPRKEFVDKTMHLKKGDDIPHEPLVTFLVNNGYVRRETVREWGEFATRGGLIDIFPPGYTSPYRLDFFGSTLETLKSFDPLSQRTVHEQVALDLKPMGEVFLSNENIERFRKSYREQFGLPDANDPLYTSISEGRVYAGYEHWLPLFYEKLNTLSDYLHDPLFCVDDHLNDARGVFIDEVRDHYQTRLDFNAIEKKGRTYNPLPPESLYRMEEDWEDQIPLSRKVIFSPFDSPEFKGNVIDAKGKVSSSLADIRASKVSIFENLKEILKGREKKGDQILIVGASKGSAERLAHILEEHDFKKLKRVESYAEFLNENVPALSVIEMGRGFEAPGLVVLTEEDVLGTRVGRSYKSKKRADLFIQEVSSLQIGDFVVHREHGIGRYEGLKTLDVGGSPHDCLDVVYEGGDKIYIPVENLDMLSRYGASDTVASLDRLGGVAWQARKARVKKRLKEVADYLLKIAAKRKLASADVFQKQAGTYDEFAARFPYPETDDQLKAIDDTLDDLTKGNPMDRLVCGDVGFGKTEIALRAAFVAAASGKQVALIVPTTLLARQHYLNFSQRFKDTGLEVALLSRLVKPSEVQKIKERLKRGEIQIIIGTHSLLSNSVEFHDLGLLIVDEEHHFGVAQKEKLKNLKAGIHVLTLTATPIPRTLQLSLAGVRDMSLITTPPLDRLAVRTFVLPFDAMVVREALLREQYRGGQSFYVCPRVSDLDKVSERLRQFVPEVKFAVANGQMTPTALENVMTDFYDGAFDVLLSTNIIESGIDVPRANTMIIHRSDLFGLAQLYQLRGRIGRSKSRGYAYLTYPAGQILSKDAQRRLEVIQSLDTLGAGFTLASHDMDLRGAGNLVGEEQSGHIREVGVELYQHMLEEAVAALKAEGVGEEYVPTDWTPQINIGVSVLIPESYVADLGLRLSLYKRLSELVTRDEVDEFAVELLDRFGPLPAEVKNLLEVIYLKSLSRQANVDKVEVGPKGVVIGFHQNTFKNPDVLINHILEQKGTAKLRPDEKVVYFRKFDIPESRLKGTRQILEELVSMAS